MAEENAGAKAETSGADAVGGFALGGAGRARADAYLDEQTRLARLQSQNLIELNAFELSHLRWRRFNDQMRGALQIMLVALGLLVVTAISAAMWNASRADGLVVESFSVPPQLGADGIGGDVVADDVTNKIAAIRDEANANSLTRSADVRQDSDDGIKVEIPETGISLAQAWRYLRQWLGHERHLRGNLRLLPGGRIALTAMLDGDSFTLEGAAGDLGKLEQQAAERVFARADPVNYVLYLGAEGRDAEAYAAAEANTRLPGQTVVWHADSYSLWADVTHGFTADLPLAAARARIGIALDPRAVSSYMELMSVALDQGDDEEALRQAQVIPSMRKADEAKGFQEAGFGYAVQRGLLTRDVETADFGAALADPCDFECTAVSLRVRRAEFEARLHDPAAGTVLLAQAAAMGTLNPIRTAQARYFADLARGDWHSAVADARAYAAAQRANGKLGLLRARNLAGPLLAVALAQDGDLAAARRELAGLPADCYACLRARGVVAALEQRWGAADYWFSRAIGLAPSIPFGYYDWARGLLARGDADAAMARLDLAHAKGPHFADPLELQGEILIARNRADLALARFEEAARHAPHWGRLHLKWGEALYWSGRKADAAAQFALARGLGLTAAERAQLALVSGQAR